MLSKGAAQANDIALTMAQNGSSTIGHMSRISLSIGTGMMLVPGEVRKPVLFFAEEGENREKELETLYDFERLKINKEAKGLETQEIGTALKNSGIFKNISSTSI